MLLPEPGIPGQAPIGYKWCHPELVQPGCPVEWEVPEALEEFRAFVQESEGTAAVKIQSRVRIWAATRLAGDIRDRLRRQHYIRIVNAVVRIQAFQRGLVARKRCLRKRQANAVTKREQDEEVERRLAYLALPAEERMRIAMEEKHLQAKELHKRKRLDAAISRNVVYIDDRGDDNAD